MQKSFNIHENHVSEVFGGTFPDSEFKKSNLRCMMQF